MYVVSYDNLAWWNGIKIWIKCFEGAIRAVEVDDVHGLVYWYDSGKIKQATLNGSNTKTVVSGTGKLNVTPL